ncbi:MAG: hypothetical protein HCA27_09240 [Dolichospermum sp. DET67]|nr:hypothetical protein [Dolichospermum sp. DET67]
MESQQGEVFLGRDWTTRSEYSGAIACRIDALAEYNCGRMLYPTFRTSLCS